MLSNSIVHGLNNSWATAVGDLTANVCQMIIASVGLAHVIYSSKTIFLNIKWAGVVYLSYLGLRKILHNSKSDPGFNQGSKGYKVLYVQGFLTSASNPKAIIFFAALFPQFVNPNTPFPAQFVVLGITYLILDSCFLFLYGIFAEIISKKLKGKFKRFFNVASGGLIIGAAVLLGLKDIVTR
jgi:threonine/homoserine/homoserine lactone efflux protein